MRDYAELVKALRHCIITIPCNKCPYYSNGNKPSKECSTMNFAAADAIEELLARDVVPTDFHERCLQLEIRKRIELEKQMPHWISVEDELPEKYESVITASKNGDVRWNYLINVKYGTWSNGYHITHWMPLPEPPKGVE